MGAGIKRRREFSLSDRAPALVLLQRVTRPVVRIEPKGRKLGGPKLHALALILRLLPCSTLSTGGAYGWGAANFGSVTFGHRAKAIGHPNLCDQPIFLTSFYSINIFWLQWVAVDKLA